MMEQSAAMADGLGKLLATHIADSESGWSMGSFGALAEFHQMADDILAVDDATGLTRATEKGAIRLDPAALSGVRPVAYETLSPKRHRWSHAVALCLPETNAAKHGRAVLTELGPDSQAIRPEDRDAILFDMGLSLSQCDFCIRTADPELLQTLRENEGRSLFDHDCTAMVAILKAHPHRIALTAIGRVEVYQKIGGPDTGGVSPPGPHTHVLPKLLKSGRTHSANTPIPAGFVPVASLHPANPVISPMGAERSFDAGADAAFQKLLATFGIPEIIAVKTAVEQALESKQAPENFKEPRDRSGRAALRMALRQARRRAEAAGDLQRITFIERWQALHDPLAASDEEEDDAPGH